MDVPSTEVQNNFGTYLKLAQVEDIYVTRNGKRIAVIKFWDESRSGLAMAAESKTVYKEENPRMTLDEFRKLSEASESRYEFIDGQVYQSASPSWDHQRVVAEVLYLLQLWSRGKKCKPVTAPFDVTLRKEENVNIVQPDIVVVCDFDKIDDQGRYSGVPTLVLEVLSESTRNLDMVKKLNIYTTSGVGEYWVINPWNREVYIYTFIAGEISNYRVFKGVENASSEVLEGITVPLIQVFEKGEHYF